MQNVLLDSWPTDDFAAFPTQAAFEFAREGATIHAENLFADFIASAQSVLRGDEIASGPLGLITDAQFRRKLAATMMQNDVAHCVDHAWMNTWRDHVDRSRFRVKGVESLNDHFCLCGTQAGLDEEDDWENDDDEDADEFEEIIEPDAPINSDSHHGIPTFWHIYLHSRFVTPEQRNRRQQAADALPAAVYLVAYYAHALRGKSRAALAWNVLDAIDRGEKLIPALAKFFRVAPAAIRAGRIMPMPSMTNPAHHGQYRRVFRSLQEANEIPHFADLDDLGENEFRWFCILDVLSQASGYRLNLLLEAWFKLSLDTFTWPNRFTREHKHQLLRWAIRRLREAHRAGARLSLDSLLEMLWQARSSNESLVLLSPQPLDTVLPCGWHVRSITNIKELYREGREMEHCIASYYNELLAGEIQVFSFCSPDGRERATLKANLPSYRMMLLEEGLSPEEAALEAIDDAIRLALAGQSNHPFPPRAVLALAEFLALLDRPGLRVAFSP